MAVAAGRGVPLCFGASESDAEANPRAKRRRSAQGRSPGGNIAARPGSLRIEDNGAPRITPCLPRPGPHFRPRTRTTPLYVKTRPFRTKPASARKESGGIGHKVVVRKTRTLPKIQRAGRGRQGVIRGGRSRRADSYPVAGDIRVLGACGSWQRSRRDVFLVSP
ncbi:hypothetical protein J3R74_001305 [Puniceicoccus vermicola]